MAETYFGDIQKTLDFVAEHIGDDVNNLVLGRSKWPDIDIDMAVNCIESRRKLKGKIQQWYDNTQLVFPLKLSAEQCSGSYAGRYKSELAEKIALGYVNANNEGCANEWKLADLTGGLGVDSWFFSQKADQVLYCEMKEVLCHAAVHNFKSLAESGMGGGNIQVRNCCVISETIINDMSEALTNIPENTATPSDILSDFKPDIVYADPARRSETGRKVFLIEECTPDILTLKDEIFRHSRHILLKLSPMADITMACSRLGRTCREVHIVSVNDECKELLIWMDREWDGDYTITAVEIKKQQIPAAEGESQDKAEVRAWMTFLPEEEKNTVVSIATADEIKGYISAINYQETPNLNLKEFPIDGNDNIYIFEPGKALLKAGAFNIIADKTNMSKLGISTHYYIGSKDISLEVARLGKLFRIIRLSNLDKKALKHAGEDFPGADVTARNLPADTETYRKKMKISPKGNSGLNKHIFCLKSDKAGALLIVGEKVV